jgi:hypothetical protein
MEVECISKPRINIEKANKGKTKNNVTAKAAISTEFSRKL